MKLKSVEIENYRAIEQVERVQAALDSVAVVTQQHWCQRNCRDGRGDGKGVEAGAAPVNC